MIYRFILKTMLRLRRFDLFEVWSFFFGYYNEMDRPIKCYNCGCKEMRQQLEDTINGEPTEYFIYCKKCKTDLSYFAYGRLEKIYSKKYKIEI